MMNDDKGWSANKIAVLGVAVGVCLSIIGVTAVRLFGHDEPTFLAQIALAGISGLVGFATGQYVGGRAVARDARAEPVAADPVVPDPAAPVFPPPASKPVGVGFPAPIATSAAGGTVIGTGTTPTGGPDRDRYISGMKSPANVAAPADAVPSMDEIIKRHS
jgi:hypothetical protein